VNQNDENNTATQTSWNGRESGLIRYRSMYLDRLQPA